MKPYIQNFLDVKLHNNDKHLISKITDYIQCNKSLCRELNGDNCKCNRPCHSCGNKNPDIIISCQTCQDFINWFNNEIKGTEDEEYYDLIKSSDMCNSCCGSINKCYLCGKTEIYCKDRCLEYVYDNTSLSRPNLELIQGCLMCDEYVCYNCTYEINDECRICKKCK